MATPAAMSGVSVLPSAKAKAASKNARMGAE
jgi:hypothetical protein